MEKRKSKDYFRHVHIGALHVIMSGNSTQCTRLRQLEYAKVISGTGVRSDHKYGQIDTKWDKSGTFNAKFSVDFIVSQNKEKTDLKRSQICLI